MVIGAIGGVMVPVQVAGCRERGVLRRYAAAGFPRWSFAGAQVVTGLALTLAASGVLRLVAAPGYGLPPIRSPVRALAGVLVGRLPSPAWVS